METARARADAAHVIVRLVTMLVAALLLAGCSGEEGLRAQELLGQAETAQRALTSSTFEGVVGVTMDATAFKLRFTGTTSRDGEWLSMQSVGAPNGEELTLQMLVRDGRAWVNTDGHWQSAPAPTAARSGGTLSAAAFQQLARHVKDVRVSEHQMIGGKPVTTIAGEIDTQGLLETLMDVGKFAEGFSVYFSKLGIEIGDIRAVLSVDERTHLLDTASVALAIKSQEKQVRIEVRYRLTSANEPVRLPGPPA